jgi:hypothetical protein
MASGGFELSLPEPQADSPNQRSRDANMPAVRRIFQIVMAMLLSVGSRTFSPVPSRMMLLYNITCGVIYCLISREIFYEAGERHSFRSTIPWKTKA